MNLEVTRSQTLQQCIGGAGGYSSHVTAKAETISGPGDD